MADFPESNNIPAENVGSGASRHALVPRGSGHAALAESPYRRPAYVADEGRENIAEYVMILRRRWKLVAAFGAATFLLAGLLTLFMKPVYRASSKLIFENRTGGLRALGANGPATMLPRLGTQVELISGRETARKAAELLKVQRGLDIPPAAIQASVRPSVIEETDLVRIDVYQQDPHLAQLFANTVAQAFVDWSEERMKKGDRETAEYLSRQLELARQELLSAENGLREFKERKRVVSLNEETSTRLARLSRLQEDAASTYASLRQVALRLTRARAEVVVQNSRLAGGVVIRDNSLIQGLRAKLVDLEAQLAEARERYTGRYPGAIGDLEKRAADTRLQLNREIQAIVTGRAGELGQQQVALEELSRLEGEEIALRARQQALGGMMGDERAVLATVPADELELARLNRAGDTAAKIYTSLLERSQEAKINQVMEVGNVEVAEAALLPGAPIKPRKALNLTFGLLCGLLLGFAAAFLLEFMDDTVKDATEATRWAQATLLGIIPRSDSERKPIALRNPKSPITEAYRTLRSNLVFTGIGIKTPAVLVSSPGVGEGKSSTVANLAITMAQTGKRVILVDTDLRRPVLHHIFELEGGPGLTDVMLGNCSLEEALYPTEVEGLRVMPCGPLPPNPAELIDSQQMAAIIEELKQRADIIFFDSPPLVPVTDAMLLSTYCDKVLLVCGSGETSRQALARARQLLDNARAPVAGVVLNKLDLNRHGHYYDSYYYYYYQDGDKKRKKRAGHTARPALPTAATGSQERASLGLGGDEQR